MQMNKANNGTFNKRLRKQRELKGWTQEELAEKVDAASKTVSRWESGMLPSLYHRRKLCEVFHMSPQELGFVREEVDEENKHLSAEPQIGHDMNSSVPQELAASLAISDMKDASGSKHSSPGALLWPPSLPDEPYYLLPRREQDVCKLVIALQDSKGPPIIVIDGLGGIGKTAIAVELARRALHQQLFEGVVGDSAQEELFTGGEIVQVREAVLDFDDLLNAIARQLGRWELPTLKVEEKRLNLAQILRQHRYLVVVDNLETAENAAALVAHLRGLMGTSKAIVTSRQQVRHDFVQALTLKELVWEDAIVFLRTDMQQRGGHPLLHTSDEELINIYNVTGGAPLAMKLVIAQARFLDLELVLNQLRQARGNLYTYIFRRSWEQLAAPAKRVLIYIGRTAVISVGWEELASVGIAEDEGQLLSAIDQLVAYSLLDVASVAEQKRYGIHQLTRQFVNSELPKIWQELS